MAAGLSLGDPDAELVAQADQAVHVGLVGLQRVGQRRVLRGQRRHLAFQLAGNRPARHGLELVHRGRVSLFALAVHKGHSPVERAHHGRSGQVLFRGEVLVNAGFGHAGLGRDLVHRHRVVALRGEQAVDRLHDGVFANALNLFLV